MNIYKHHCFRTIWELAQMSSCGKTSSLVWSHSGKDMATSYKENLMKRWRKMWNRLPGEPPHKMRGNTPTCLPFWQCGNVREKGRLIILYYYNSFVCGLNFIILHHASPAEWISSSTLSQVPGNQLFNSFLRDEKSADAMYLSKLHFYHNFVIYWPILTIRMSG